MSFELWLFTVKQLGQTFDDAQNTYWRLDNEKKGELVKEFKESGLKENTWV